MKRFVLAGTVTLVAAALLGGCVGGTDNGDGTSKTLSWALGIADELADAWNPDNKLTAIVGMWVDESGELDEPADNPRLGESSTPPTTTARATASWSTTTNTPSPMRAMLL